MNELIIAEQMIIFGKILVGILGVAIFMVIIMNVVLFLLYKGMQTL